MRRWLVRFLARNGGPGEQPRAILLARVAELERAIADLERERDYWRGRVDATTRDAEVSDDLVEDIRRLIDRERGRGINKPT